MNNLSDITVKTLIGGSIFLTLSEDEKRKIGKYKRMSKRAEIFWEMLQNKIEKMNSILQKEMPEFDIEFECSDSYSMDEDNFIVDNG